MNNEYLDSLPRSIQAKTLRIHRIRFTYNTNKIEGSRLNLKDVALINEDHITPGNKPINDIIEAKSHMSLFEELVNCKKNIDVILIVEWHKKLFELTKLEFA